MQQRNRRMPARQEPVTDDAMEQEDEYDDAWPTRLPSSSRRYLAQPDVYMETGRRPADVRSLSSRVIDHAWHVPMMFQCVVMVVT